MEENRENERNNNKNNSHNDNEDDSLVLPMTDFRVWKDPNSGTSKYLEMVDAYTP